MITLIAINNSGVKLYRRCPQAYYYKEVEGIEPCLGSLPLTKGTWMHFLLEDYFLGKDWKKTHNLLAKQFNKHLMLEEREIYGDLPTDCLRMMTGYVDRWKDHKFKTLAVELDFAKTPVPVAPGVFIKGKIDLVMKDSKGVWVVEHKNMKSIPSEDDRFLDIQTVLYTLAVIHLMKLEPTGVMWDYLRTKPPTKPDVLKNGTVSRNKRIDTDYDTYLAVIKEAGEDPKDYKEELERARSNPFHERRYMPKSDRVITALLAEFVTTARIIEKLAHYPYRTINRFTCNSCGYRTLCEAELLGLDSRFIRLKDFRPVKKYENSRDRIKDLFKGGDTTGKKDSQEEDL